MALQTTQAELSGLDKEASGCDITEIINAGLVGANGVAVDRTGTIYVAGQDSYNVITITSGGVIAEIIGSTGDGTGNALGGNREIPACMALCTVD